MSTTFIIVTVFAALFVAFSAVSMFLRAAWLVRNLERYGVPRAWWPWLATAKAAGAAGLLAGLVVPVIGVVAGIALVLYFVGAFVTVVRARSYGHIPAPLMYLTAVVASLVVGASG